MADVEVFGEKFTLAGEVSEFALMEFADAASQGQDGDTMLGMASMYRLTQDCIAESDWARFRHVARKNKAKAANLMEVVKAAFEVQSERPTGLPADSSDGHVVIDLKPASNSADKASETFPGRPDLQLAVLRARGAA